MTESESQAIEKAIRNRLRLSFRYNGLLRIVEPYCLGTAKDGRELLRAIQVDGDSNSGGFGFGKLWHVDKMTEVTVTLDRFVADDPDYNPDDRAMASIHCRIAKR